MEQIVPQLIDQHAGASSLVEVPPSPSDTAAATPAPKPRWNPARLTSKHKGILSLYAQGEKRDLIATLHKCTPEYVTMLARTESGSAYIQDIQRYIDERLDNMTAKSVQVIDEALAQDQPMDTRLKGAALQLKAAGRMQEDTSGKGGASAEDVIARIMNLQVNVKVGGV